MPKKNIYRALLLLFAFVLLGCALTAKLQEGDAGSTPTPALALASPVATEPPTPSATLLPEASATPLPAVTALPPTPSLTPSPVPTTPSSSGLLREVPGQPDPLPENVNLMRQPVSQADRHSAAVLADSVVPVRDLRSLAIRLGGVRADVPAVITDTSPDYDLGTVRSFKVHDDDSDQTFLIEAELRYKTAHVYMWVETGVDIDPGRLQQAADTFEKEIYPTDRAFFGSEWTPGVDGDPHLGILHARGIGSGVAGYYWSADEYPAEVRPDSNQMEMFYINADNANVGSAFYLGTLAHEFQHMIHWYNDRNEETWLNEGMSELASLITGFDPGGSDYGWSRRPDTQLNTWSDDDARSAHYGGSYLFAAYLLDRFGETLTQAVVAHPANGIPSIDAVLAENETGLTFTDVFADWLVANYLDQPELADGRFGYDLIDTAQPLLAMEHDRYPAKRVSDVTQYGVDYIYLEGGQDLTVDFFGETRARLLSTGAHSGDQFWYSNRGDDSDMRLTRRFDLGDVSQATLRFWTWYDIEAGWDYGYVMVSNDDGATWSILRGDLSTDVNPHGNSYGWSYTGLSGEGPVWVEESISLDDFAGQQILVRFEYITDDALNSPGWAIDDISIPELGYRDDVEAGTAGWQAEGFVQTGNFVPQEHLVQVILFDREITVERLPLLENQSARWQLPLADADHAVLVVSGLAEVTTEPTNYFYQAGAD
jgi:immune inhibitor A